jgi:hypothetical protein
MKAVVLALVLALGLVSGTGGGVALQPAATAVVIPFELAVRHVIVKVTINGSRPLSFVLDTGANVAIVRMPVAKELGLQFEGSVSTGGAGEGRQAGQRVKNARWSLVGLEGFSQPVSLALPFPALPSGLGQDVDGIIGGEFIKEFVIELDYQARRLTLYNRKTFAYTGTGHPLPIELNSNNHPVLKAKVTPAGGKPTEDQFVLDIGSGGGLILHSPFVAMHKLPGAEVKTVRAIGMVGAGGRSVGRVGRVDSLQIGPYTIKEVPTTFSEDEGGAFADRTLGGNIGARVADRFKMFIDYSRKRIILEPSSKFAEAFDGLATGLAVRAFGADYRTFRVVEVLEDSPASDAGLVEGDVITDVNGAPAEKFTLTLLLEALVKPGSHRLTIQRGDTTVAVTLTPRRLV